MSRQPRPQTSDPVPVSHPTPTEEEDSFSPSHNSEEDNCASTLDLHESDDLVRLNEDLGPSGAVSYDLEF